MVARRLRPAALALVRLASVSAGDRVLDIGAGTGNVALAAARMGASVTAVDNAPGLVEIGRRRCEDAGAAVDWRQGDMDALDVPEAWFDATLSAFGLSYSTDPERAMGDAFRVTAADGCVGVVTWPRGSFQHEAQRALAAFSGGSPASSPWADPDGVRQLLGRHASAVVAVEITFEWWFDEVDAWVDEAARAAPPLVALLDTLDRGGRDSVRGALRDVAQRFASTGSRGVAIAQEALVAIGWKR